MSTRRMVAGRTRFELPDPDWPWVIGRAVWETAKLLLKRASVSWKRRQRPETSISIEDRGELAFTLSDMAHVEVTVTALHGQDDADSKTQALKYDD